MYGILVIESLNAVTGIMAVVKLDGVPQLCKTDEVGELCLSSNYSGTGYWGLQGVSNSIFKVRTASVHVTYIVVYSNKKFSTYHFQRSSATC